ncbi:innexin-11-like [Mytilus californianus]|uniref:innexin-11-like n=1 Tax=Mytilus californianus TaxID=6549 RepID=UPI0022460905|nr:innexin-11-like [Mytilus californianus]
MDMRCYNKPSISHGSWSDRLNTSLTCGLFLLLSIVTWLRQYIGPNAVCVTPETSGEQLNKYFDNTCWLSRELLLEHDVIPFHNRDVKTLPLIQNENRRFENVSRSLYQWVPVILIIQALFFRIPYILVKLCDDLFGIRFSRIICSIDSQVKHDGTRLAQDIAQFLDQFLRSRGLKYHRFGLLSTLVGVSKVLIFINAFVQLILLDLSLSSPGTRGYMQHIVENLLQNNYSNTVSSPAFPRQIQCLIYIRRAQHLSVYSAQCSLPINEFYEHVCLLLWIWLFILCLISFAGAVTFLVKALRRSFRERYIIRYLNMSEIEPEPCNIVSFTTSVLGYDGFLVLEAIGEIYSDILVRDIVINLWNANYSELQPIEFSQESLQVPNSNYLKVPFKESRITLASKFSTPETTPLITRRCFKV